MYNSDLPSRAELPSTGRLLRSTLLALVTAMALLVTVVLPSEYGIDPTGIGEKLQLTEMGRIKMKLAREAEAERVASAAKSVAVEKSEDAGLAPDEGATPSAASESRAPEAIAPAEDEAARPEVQQPAQASAEERTPEAAPLAVARSPEEAPPAAKPEVNKPVQKTRKDQMSVVLKPDQGAEIKMQMKKGATASFAWSVEGGVVNFDAHGDGGDNAISYEKGRGVGDKQGVLEAAFDGIHGWYWRNRGKSDVTLTLNTEGEYSAIKRTE